MLKVLRNPTSIYRNFSKAASQANYEMAGMSLVAQPAKLQKKIHFKGNPRWLHQDVKVGSKTVSPEIDGIHILELAKQCYSNSYDQFASRKIDHFCNECITRLGIDIFKQFVEFNQHRAPYLKESKDFEKHLPTCLRILNQDAFLLRLLAMCNIKAINKNSVSKYQSREATETDAKKQDGDLSIYKLLPKAQPIFDSYKNLEENIIDIKDSQENNEDQNDEPKLESEIKPEEIKLKKIKLEEIKPEEMKPEEIQLISGTRYIYDSIITFHQIPTDYSQKTNWVYFQLESGQDSMLTEEGVISCLKKVKISSWKNINIVKPEELVQKSKIISTRITVDDVKKSYDHELDFLRLSTLSQSNRLSPAKAPELEDEALSGNFSSFTSEIEQNVKKFEEMIRFCSKVNTRSRAYGFAELDTYEEKEKILSNVYRLFGIEYEKAFLVIDDADNKKTVHLNNMPWNLKPKTFANWLNLLGSSTQAPIKFTIDEGLENYLSDANYYYLEMNSFSEARMIIEAINSSDYSEKKVNASFKRGCGRFVNGRLIENYISPNIEKQQRVHIERRTRTKEAYLKNIANRPSRTYDGSVNR